MATHKELELPGIEALANAGVHFGHRTRQWSPKMEKNIYGTLDGVHVINLEITLEKLREAAEYLQSKRESNATVVIVGTKRQAAPVIRGLAEKAKVYYISERWPGGLITNFDSIRSAIKTYEELSSKMADEEYVNTLSTKQKFINLKEIERLGKIFAGLKGLDKKPDLLIVVDPRRERTAVHEAQISNTETIAIVDTNTSPDIVTYAIPANDDALKSIEIILTSLLGLYSE